MSTETKKGMGLFAKIFITLAIVFFVISGCMACGAYLIFRKVSAFTSKTPASIPSYSATQDEYDGLLARLGQFRKTAEAGQAATLELSANDINTLIALDPNWKEAKGKLFVEIEKDQLTAQASVPLTEVPGFRDRYLNGRVTLKITANNGVVFIRPEAIDVNGQPVPAEFLKSLQERNLAEQLNQDPNLAATRQRIQDLKIEGGKIVVKTAGGK